MPAQPGHGPHVAADGVDEAGPYVGPRLADRKPPPGGGAPQGRVRRDGEVGLGDADGKAPRTRWLRNSVEAAGRPRAGSRRRRRRRPGWRWSRSSPGARLRRVEEPELGGFFGGRRPRPRPAQWHRPAVARSGCTPRHGPPWPAISRMAACSEGKSSGKALMATTGVTPWRTHDLELLAQVGRPGCTSSGFSASMAGGSGLPATTRCPPECSLSARTVVTTTAASGARPDVPALDVEEALGAHVGPEAGLGDEEVAGVDPDQVGDHRRVAVGDVAEWAGVDEHRRVLERLQQVGLDGVAHDHGHGPGGLELLGRDRLAAAGVADDDPSQPAAHVAQGRREGQDGHDLRRPR